MERPCRGCAAPLDGAFRFCPWCGAVQRLKLVELFRAHPLVEPPTRALRVSRYLGDEPADRHVRLSVWDDDRVVAAISLDEAEAARLARFVEAPVETSAVAT